ncbi:MAG: hypothetical protein ACLP6E_18180 [Acidimicrobiales bacterium]
MAGTTGAVTETSAPGGERGAEEAPGRHGIERTAASGSRRGRSAAGVAVAFAGYLALAIGLWWNVWSTHPTSVTSCACGDASLFIWFLEWPAYAIAHGHDPFYSTALFHPSGINLLSNTSVLAVGVVLAPVTWLFGPVATMNVASTLGPALSALAMFWLLRRWVNWTPAAFVGGLLFGFSPFVFVNVVGGHLMTTFLAVVPLIVACLDEIFVRQTKRPMRVGITLGLLVTLQFFLSTEVLVICLICGVVALPLLLLHAAASDPGTITHRASYALRALAVAASVSIILLAYPLWFALDGPAHLAGLIWPTLPPGAGGIALGNVWHVGYQTALRNLMQIVGGYEGPALPQAEFLGLGVLIVVALGILGWRRDRRLWFFCGLGVLTTILSLGVNTHFWVPWNLLAHVPLVRSIVPSRFFLATTLCAAAAVSIVVDRAHSSVADRGRRIAGSHSVRASRAWPVSILASVVALGISAVAVAPVTAAVATNVPITTRDVTLPRWFAEAGPGLAAGQVVLAYPAPFTLVQSSMAWQAVDLLRFALVGGGGPGGVPERAGKERAGFEVVSAMSFSLDGPPSPSPANIEAVREALAGWRVTIVVVPDPAGLPRYDQGTDPASALGLFTVSIGRPPRFVDDAWVWTRVQAPGASLEISTSAFDRCTNATLSAVTSCVIASSGPGN